MAEKVRYYLEQMVPELEDLQNKGLFDKREITMIMRRRTDFEYRIQGRGSKARDFLKYYEFEENVEKLRKKRYRRLSSVGLVDTKPSISDWAGTRRIMFIFDRATRRYPGDMSIWTQYLRYAKDNGAIKVIYKVYSRLLQLHPRNIDAWISAANYEFETNGNAKGARVILQKALRFNPDSLELWLAYAQLELTYISRLLVRRKLLGLLTEKQQKAEMDKEEAKFNKLMKDNEGEEDFRKDLISLQDSDESLKDELNHLPEADMNMLGNPETNPALRGDVVLTVFDIMVPSLLKNQNSTIISKSDRVFKIVNAFLKLIGAYGELNRDYLFQHVVNYLQTYYPDDLRTYLVDITLPIRTELPTEKLPDALQLSVNKFIAYKGKLSDSAIKSDLSTQFTNYLQEKFMNDKPPSSAKINALLQAIIKKCQDDDI